MTIAEWSAAEVAARQPELARFEAGFRYPLGQDTFRIDHGARYLAFFETLGRPRVFAALRDGRVLGLLVAVWRAPLDAWYLCDLKVAPDAGGRGLSQRLLRAFASAAAPRRVYGVSMNPAAGANRLARALARRSAVELGARLVLHSLERDGFDAIADACRRRLGALGWLSHAGRKDIVLASTGLPLPLLHLQHGPCARPEVDGPVAGRAHMLCVPDDHVLAAELVARGLAPTATASVLHVGMGDVDWSFVLTSDV